MSTFKVGDRVVYYSHAGAAGLKGNKGVVSYVHIDGRIDVRVNAACTHYGAHPKQCRKLKAKPQRVFEGEGHVGRLHSAPGYSEFRAVNVGKRAKLRVEIID